VSGYLWDAAERATVTLIRSRREKCLIAKRQGQTATLSRFSPVSTGPYATLRAERWAYRASAFLLESAAVGTEPRAYLPSPSGPSPARDDCARKPASRGEEAERNARRRSS